MTTNTIENALRGLEQYFAEHPDVEWVGAVEANEYLERKGFYRDYPKRAGLPLRKLLRDGKIPGAEKVGARWRIHRLGLNDKK